MDEMRFAAQLVDDIAEDGRTRQFVLSHRQDDQNPRGPDPARKESHQPDAHLVSPVNVLEHDENGLFRGKAPHQFGRTLEEPQTVGPMSCGFSAGGSQLGE